MGQLCSCHSGNSRRRKDFTSSWSNLLSRRSALSSWRRRRMRSEEFLGHDNLPLDPNPSKAFHIINGGDKQLSFASRRSRSAPEQNGFNEPEPNELSEAELNGVSDAERDTLDEGIERTLRREALWSDSVQEARRRRVTHQWQRSNGAKSLDLHDGVRLADGNEAPPMLIRRLLKKRANFQLTPATRGAPPGDDPWNCARLVDGTKEWLCGQLDPWALFQSLQCLPNHVDCGLLALELGRCTTKHDSCRCLLEYATVPLSTEDPDGQRPNFGRVRQALGSSEDKRLLRIAEFLDVVDAIIDLAHVIRRRQSSVGGERISDEDRTLDDPAETLPSSSGDCLNGIPPLPDLRRSPMTDFRRSKDGYFRSEIVHPTHTRPCLYATSGSVDRGSVPIRRDLSFTRRRHSALCHSDDEPPSTSWPPPAEPEMPSLSLSIYDIDLSVDGAKALTRILVDHGHVTHLSIVRTGLDDPSAFGDLCSAFARRTAQGIVHFDFRMNHLLAGDCIGQLSGALRRATALRSINLSSTGLSADACRCLVDALRTGSAANRVLAELDLGFNELNDEGCCAVAELIESPGCGLRKLRLRHNGIGRGGARRLAAALLTHPRLTLLDVSSNPVGDGGVSSLAESLLGNRTLRDVALDDCGVSGEGCRGVARMLATNSVLRSLSLSRNSLGDEGVRALAEGVRYNRTVEVIGLDMCCLGNAGFVCLLQELRWCHSMRVVRACYNAIGLAPDQLPGCRRWSSATVRFDAAPRPTGSEPRLLDVYAPLCEVLRLNPKLKIFLWGNRIGEDDDEDDDDDVTSASVFRPEVGERGAKWRRSRSAVDSGYGTLSRGEEA